MKNKRLSGFLFFAFVVIFLVAAPSWALDGDLDTSFGTGGKVTTDIGDIAYALGIQSDGKIVVAGDFWNGGNFDFAVVRYNTDGSVDTTFGTGGKVTTAIGSYDDYAYALGIQSDGKIVAAGRSWNGSNFDFAVVRYNTDGTLDTTFGTGGKITTAIGGGDDWANALGIQSDGKIVAAGYSSNGSNTDFAVVRYNTDGTLDTTFGTGGKITTAIGGGDDWANALGIQSDGKIVATGDSSNGINYDFAVVRYNTDGTLDTTFGTGGKITTAIGGGDDWARALGIQSDGKIVVAGFGNNDFAVVRYNTDATLDTTFGAGGKITTAIGGGDDWANALGIQSDGKIVVAGNSWNGGNFDFAVVRYNTDGSVDTTFGTGGKVTTAIGGSSHDEARALGIQSDGKIVVAGSGGNSDFALARYLATDSGTGTRNANGTYTLDAGTLTINTTASDFICDGLIVGTEIITGVTITTDTMTWPGDSTWTRSPAGAANDPVGVWTMTDSATGNAYTLIINSNGTFSLEGIIIQCGQQDENPRARSQHWSSGYYVPLSYDDPGQSATAVSVTGPGITDSLSLAYDTNWGGWNSWILDNTPFLGATSPTGLPYTYTFTITDTTTWTADSIVSCFQEEFATNLFPTGTISTTPTFSWTGIGDAGALYAVELNDTSYNRIWNSYDTYGDISGTSIVYNGSALTSGTTYIYDVLVQSSTACSNGQSFAQGSFTYQTSLYVVWADDTYGNNEIFIKKSTDNGTNWTTTRLTNNAGNSQNPVMSVDGSTVYIVWQDDTYGNNEIFLKKSTDAGTNWTTTRLTDNAGNSQAPALAVSGSTVYIVWQDDTYGNNEIYLKKSADAGANWTTTRLTNNAGNSQLSTVMSTGSDVYIVWQDDTYGPAGVSEIFLKKSTDGGTNWTTTRLTTNAGNSQNPVMSVDGSTVYIVWQDDTYGNNEVFIKKSTDGGANWTTTRLTNNAGNSQFPTITVKSGIAYVVWQDDTYGNNEVFLKKSTDAGANWTTTRLTNNAGNSQLSTVMSTSSDVYIVWQDDTYGPAGVSEIFLKKSTDGGTNWTTTRLTTNAGNSAQPSMPK